ncbi:hypothetical protein [Xanthomonas sacchari]|uniref:hypothetical protein n=1 Tax=Xanthomonas sacchari TaxID=56458 RepID=UPI0022573657|nr:hypothetical protein [Xanthomonas sacchari]MCW0370240.1 hypothetical protein [Xanthomonas sacchari]
MSSHGAVDVLEVLDLAAERERAAGMPDGVQIAARAAVAELIAAADQVSFSRRGEEDWERLDAALARCGGAQ